MAVEPKVFIDTNVLLYLLSADEIKATRAEQVVEIGGVISVQVLNEFTNVARRKLSMSWDEIREFLMAIRAICTVVPLTESIYDEGCGLTNQYGFSVYDSMIVAAALHHHCDKLLSEGMQDGLIVDRTVTICNPFKQ